MRSIWVTFSQEYVCLSYVKLTGNLNIKLLKENIK